MRTTFWSLQRVREDSLLLSLALSAILLMSVTMLFAQAGESEGRESWDTQDESETPVGSHQTSASSTQTRSQEIANQGNALRRELKQVRDDVSEFRKTLIVLAIALTLVVVLTVAASMRLKANFLLDQEEVGL